MEEMPDNNGFVDNEDDELNIDEEFEEEKNSIMITTLFPSEISDP